MHLGSLPEKQGLYDPTNEHDACGVGFVAHIKGEKSHGIVEQGLTILKHIVHRGAVGADPKAGDGAGLLMQIPDTFFRAVLDFELPDAGQYGVGMLFLPKDDVQREAIEQVVNQTIEAEGLSVLGWRTVPVDNSGLGESVKPTEPSIRQVFINANAEIGHHCNIYAKVLIDSDTKVSDFVQIGANSTINSNCEIGEGAFIGSGVTIISGIKIGKKVNRI